MRLDSPHWTRNLSLERRAACPELAEGSSPAQRGFLERDTEALTPPLERVRPLVDPFDLRLDDFAAAQARRAHADALGRAPHLRVNRTQVDVPAPLAHVVGVADDISRHRLLAANLTNLCHSTALQEASEIDV